MAEVLRLNGFNELTNYELHDIDGGNFLGGCIAVLALASTVALTVMCPPVAAVASPLYSAAFYTASACSILADTVCEIQAFSK